MSVDRDDLAARLAEHGDYTYDDERNDWFCDCGARIPDGEGARLTQHIADVALAWFQEQTKEEWAVLYERMSMGGEICTQIERARNEEAARRLAAAWGAPTASGLGWNHRAEHRRVTAWEPVEGEEA